MPNEAKSVFIKDEGFDSEGRLIGPLSYADGRPVFNDGRWVNFKQARTFAEAHGYELDIV